VSKRILALAISIAYYGCRLVYHGLARLLFGRSPETPLVVLTYHAVPAADVRHFEHQVALLVQRTKTVFADARVAPGGGPTVAVTFDDGLQSVFDYALPVLARYRVPATLFVPTGFLGTSPGWVSDAPQGTAAGEVLMSADCLKSLDRQLVKIGSHTVTHPRLARLDADRRHAELVTSRQTLETITGTRVAMLSLPYGSCNDRVIAAAERAGYDQVFANVPVERSVGDTSRLFGRVNVTLHDWRVEFLLKIHGGYDWMAMAVPAKREVLKLVGRIQEA
jgi:peptidoglycan/xylan/chitin deacetylase (PgdA/CDA1 family)